MALPFQHHSLSETPLTALSSAGAMQKALTDKCLLSEEQMRQKSLAGPYVEVNVLGNGSHW